MQNSGGGIGANYEHTLFRYFSIKGGLGHMTFKTSLDDVYCTSVDVSLFLNVYPFGEGLSKLYFGIGNGADFMNYFGSGALPETGKDVVIFLTPHIGYKLYCFKYIIFDLNIGHRINIISSNNYYNVYEYLKPGIQFNLGINILLSKIVKAVLSKKAAVRSEGAENLNAGGFVE
ncbi:MAG: hypothetical protein LBD20_08870 [Spirochaetaceae bacterium]|nr:hypothetical protein [Spirochaetaceae bacterium]